MNNRLLTSWKIFHLISYIISNFFRWEGFTPSSQFNSLVYSLLKLRKALLLSWNHETARIVLQNVCKLLIIMIHVKNMYMCICMFTSFSLWMVILFYYSVSTGYFYVYTFKWSKAGNTAKIRLIFTVLIFLKYQHICFLILQVLLNLNCSTSFLLPWQ